MFKHLLSILLIPLASLSYYSFAGTLPKSEPLYGFSISENTITILVKSTGCTKPADFHIEVVSEAQESLVSVSRIRRDRCRAMPRIVPIDLELVTGQQLPYRITNLFYSHSVTRR